jgi:beta-galactosidase
LNGKVKVYNENFFIDLSRYSLEWDVEVDGAKVLTGVMNVPAIAPQATQIVDLGYDKSQIEDAAGKAVAEADVYLNVKYVLRRVDGILPAGSQVAYDQICINKSIFICK